jgi:hypothetical protein
MPSVTDTPIPPRRGYWYSENEGASWNWVLYGAETIIHDSSFTESHSRDIAVSFGNVYVGVLLNYPSGPMSIGVYDVSAETWFEVPTFGYSFTVSQIEWVRFKVAGEDVFLAALISDDSSYYHPGYWRNGTMSDLELPSEYPYGRPTDLTLGY